MAGSANGVPPNAVASSWANPVYTALVWAEVGKVYNDTAYQLSEAVGSFPSSLVAKARSVTAPEPFVETKESLDEHRAAEVAA